MMRSFDVLDSLHLQVEQPLPSQLSLNRCWPQSADHLMLEYSTADGVLIPGQWFADSSRLASLEAQLDAIAPGRAWVVQAVTGDQLLLQTHGIDPVLSHLHVVLRDHSMQLLSHRPGKRAVVRQVCAEGVSFCKYYSSSKAFQRSLLHASYVQRSASGSFRYASIVDADPPVRCIHSLGLDGSSLYDLLASGWQDSSVARQIGQCLRSFHQSGVPAELAVHDRDREIAVIRHWLSIVSIYFPDRSDMLSHHADRVIQSLDGVSESRALLHRDLHDKQLLLAPDCLPGLIDFDTLACGPAALDLANLLAHLEWRVLQGKARAEQALAVGAALIEGYDCASTVQDLQPFLDATRIRLACVYAFRPRWRSAALAIPARIGRPWGAS